MEFNHKGIKVLEAAGVDQIRQDFHFTAFDVELHEHLWFAKDGHIQVWYFASANNIIDEGC
jgi:hypothetical protein